MLLIRLSSKRMLEISEYYILIPLMLAIELAIAQKLKKNRSQNNDKSKEFTKWKIFYFAMGRLRGGNEITQFLEDNYLDVKHLDCIVRPGIQYLNNARLRKIINYLFHDKVKNDVIFITRTALCHIASEYGLYQLDLPIPIHTPVAFTNKILLLQKAIISGFIVTSSYNNTIRNNKCRSYYECDIIFSRPYYFSSYKRWWPRSYCNASLSRSH